MKLSIIMYTYYKMKPYFKLLKNAVKRRGGERNKGKIRKEKMWRGERREKRSRRGGEGSKRERSRNRRGGEMRGRGKEKKREE